MDAYKLRDHVVRFVADHDTSGIKHGLLRENLRHWWRTMAPHLHLEIQRLWRLVKYQLVRVRRIMVRDELRPHV